MEFLNKLNCELNRQDLIRDLKLYGKRWPAEMDNVDQISKFLMDEKNGYNRDCWHGHITGSAWLVDPGGEQVLLTHHKKLNRWLQLGGHSDGDENTLRVAMREAEEESGLKIQPTNSEIFDIDIHTIPARKTEPEHLHLDIRYVFQAESTDERVSEESHALAWVPVRELSSFTTEESMLRMAKKWLDRQF